MSEQEEFLKDLDADQKTDVLEEPLTDDDGKKTPEEGEETAEEKEMKLKNRRERRLAEKWQKERESNIALNARLEALSESRTVRETSAEADYLKRAEKIYGTETPENREATELLKEALKGVHESARKEALAEALETFEQQREKESKAVRAEEDAIDEILETVEDETDLDLSEGGKDRKGFLTLLEKLSPKDKDGNIIEYADPITTAELYESRKEKTTSRAKELAGRSMVRSGASSGTKLEEDSAVRFLKENGII